MKKFIIWCILAQLLFSCDFLFDNQDSDGEKKFWATNMRTGENYQLKAELLASGSYCNVWVEKGSGVTEDTAKKMADEYDYNIYQKMIDNFSVRDFSVSGYKFSNIMQYADAATDRDGKLTILLLDIKDDYQRGVNDSYYGGYFWAVNLVGYDPVYPITRYSNLCDMIYIDTNPGMSTDEMKKEAYSTLAHEMQHLMNFMSTVLYRKSAMDTWIDEGLSAAAEYVYAGESKDRMDWFNNNGAINNSGAKVMSGLIDKGNNFFVWGNRTSENQYALLDDYATVYLFFQWLKLQGSSDIYKKIISSENSDYNAVVKNISGYDKWDSLLETWLAANRINAPGGQFGYKGALTVKATYVPEKVTSVQLYPGEGVYSLASSNPNVNSSGNIVYKFITGNVVNPGYSANSTLLTYNKSTTLAYDKDDNLTTTPDSGVTTGAAPPASVDIAFSEGRSARPFNGPYRIDSGNFLRRDISGMDFSGLLKGLEADE